MISQILKERLISAADRYERADFICSDPVMFPRRFSYKRDMEISGLLTAMMSFGNRKQIITKTELLFALMNGKPTEYVLEKKYEQDFPKGRKDSFYRMMSYDDFRRIFERLQYTYYNYKDMESCLLSFAGTPMERMCRLLDVTPKSPQKKINMFLRWMIRRNSPVDLGIWKNFSPGELLVPLDTHVIQTAFDIGLISTKTYSLETAKCITSILAEVFPDDPARGDFALFGMGITKARDKDKITCLAF